VHSLIGRLVENALLVLFAVLVLSWAWDLLRPLLPFVVTLGLCVGFLRWRRR
jgi:hypothetical protein